MGIWEPFLNAGEIKHGYSNLVGYCAGFNYYLFRVFRSISRVCSMNTAINLVSILLIILLFSYAAGAFSFAETSGGNYLNYGL